MFDNGKGILGIPLLDHDFGPASPYANIVFYGFVIDLGGLEEYLIAHPQVMKLLVQLGSIDPDF